jgi:transcription termination factor Rho
MDFKNASLAEMKQFVKDNKIKGVSALNKKDLAEFLTNNYGEQKAAAKSENDESKDKVNKKPNIKNDSKQRVSLRGNRSNTNRAYSKKEGAKPEQPKKDVIKSETLKKDGIKSESYKNDVVKSEAHKNEGIKSEAPKAENKNTDNIKTESNPFEQNMSPELDSGKVANGILEVMSDGYGFIRSANYLPGDQDIYVSPAQIRRFGLKTGDIINGNIRVKTQGEKFSALLYVNTVNGEPLSVIAKRKPFEELTPIFPNERIKLDGNDSPVPIRMIDLLAPIGKGQRGMIVSPPKTGKTTLLKQIAKCISTKYRDIHLLVLLIDERPEEVTDIRESIEGPNVEVIYSTFDELPEHHKRVSEMVIERAKRLVEQKQDVVILLDSITRLARAYNLTVPPSGRTLSGGLDPAALHMPKRFFGAARNMREGGSLTILATALVETGSKMDDVVFEEFKGTGNMELVLDRKLSEKRIFPAIDIAKSGTRRDDLLLTKEEQEVVYAIHKALSGNKAEDILEDVLKLFVRTKNNEEFMYYVKKSLLRK